MSKLKYALLAMFLVVLAAPLAMAGTLNDDDLAFAFGECINLNHSDSLALLSSAEMVETEGEWAANVARGLWKFARTMRVKGHYDRKPHRFSNAWGPLQGNRPHYQITIYRKGARNSNFDIRIPWGSPTTWGSHRR